MVRRFSSQTLFSFIQLCRRSVLCGHREDQNARSVRKGSPVFSHACFVTPQSISNRQRQMRHSQPQFCILCCASKLPQHHFSSAEM